MKRPTRREPNAATGIDPVPSNNAGAHATGDHAVNMMSIIKANASGATISVALHQMDPYRSEFDAALADYIAKRDYADGVALDDPGAGAAVEAACAAMDHLIESVPAPDRDAVQTKLNLARERSATIVGLFDDHRTAILADLRRLAGTPDEEIAATPARGNHAICDDQGGLFADLPDLRTGRTLEDALCHLQAVLEIDPDSYPEEWIEEIEDVGGSVSVNYPEEGDRQLSVGRPCDRQYQERGRRIDALGTHLHSIEGMYGKVGNLLERRGHCTDSRPRDMRETTAALRGFLTAGYRVFVRPDGSLDTGGGMPAEWWHASPERSAEIEEAGRRFVIARRRWRNLPQIKRAVRLLGQPHQGSGCIVLQGEG